MLRHSLAPFVIAAALHPFSDTSGAHAPIANTLKTTVRVTLIGVCAIWNSGTVET